MANIYQELEKNQTLLAATLLQAYLECGDEIQAGIREMLTILRDPETDPDDREMTLRTLHDAIFPHPYGRRGIDVESESIESKDTERELDNEEIVFAERVAEVMKERQLTQEQLAHLAGVSQPAISNMLSRRCRPQRSTVERIAKALGIKPVQLWPEYTSG